MPTSSSLIRWKQQSISDTQKGMKTRSRSRSKSKMMMSSWDEKELRVMRRDCDDGDDVDVDGDLSQRSAEIEERRLRRKRSTQ